MQDIVTQVLAYAYAAWRRRGYAVAVAWLVCTSGWAAVAVLPDIFRSSALVHVDTASVLQPLLQGLTVEIDPLAEIELMQKTLLSRPNIEKVARAADLDLAAKTSSDMERLIQDLTRRIELQRQAVDLFQISFEDSDPNLAHRIVQELLAIFVEANLGQNRGDMDNARRFIEDQIARYEQKLAEAERNIVDFKQRNFGLLAGQVNQFRSFEAVENNVAEIETSLREARLRRATLQKELQQIPQFFPTTNQFGAGPPTDVAVQILDTYKLLDDLRSRYTEKHPDVVVAQRKLDALLEQQRKELEAAAAAADKVAPDANLPDTSGISNPVYEQIKVQVVQVEAEIASLEDRVAQAREELAKARETAGRTPELETELARLERDYGVLLTSYQQLLASRETEQISRARDSQAENIRFRVMEPPTVPAIPSGPNRLIFLALVTVVGLASGTGFAILLAFSSDTFSSVVELRSTVGVTVLGGISIAEIAQRGFWARGKPVVFWIALVMLVAAFAALWFAELRIGLNDLVMDEILAGGIPDWLRRLPIF